MGPPHTPGGLICPLIPPLAGHLKHLPGHNCPLGDPPLPSLLLLAGSMCPGAWPGGQVGNWVSVWEVGEGRKVPKAPSTQVLPRAPF